MIKKRKKKKEKKKGKKRKKKKKKEDGIFLNWLTELCSNLKREILTPTIAETY